MPRHYRALNGVLLFDKPLELSSNNALQKVRHLFQAKKAGHTGTLDPLATGLLPICFGEATKFSNALFNADKTYFASICLGQTTTTGDAEGDILSQKIVSSKSADIENVLEQFRGDIQQIPPMYSALKHKGKPLYEYIRAGKTIERQPRDVVIHELLLNHFEGDALDITVRCSKGTYIRTLAEDIGAVLGCGAHLIGLRRTAIAHFKLQEDYNLSKLTDMTEAQRDACLLPIDSMMPDMPILDIDAVQVRRLGQGQRLALENEHPNGKIRLNAPEGFVGVGIVQGHRLEVDRLLSSVAIQAAKTSNIPTS